MDVKEILKHVDHTLLLQPSTWEEIKQICDDAMEYGTASVCIPPSYVKQAAEYMNGKMAVCTVIGFPNGYMTTAAKEFETKDALANGASEIDMVINIGALKDGLYDYVRDEIKAVVEAVEGRTVKVIIETGLLTEYEKSMATKLACDAGAQFVKTCTGVSPGKATVEDVKLMLENIPEYEDVQVKASSGIRTYEDAIALIEAGAERLGTSSGIAIIEGAEIVGAL